MLVDKVRETIRRLNLLEFGDKVLVAVSGGPDSVALLLILNNLRHEFGTSLHIAHLDHMLRYESAKDAAFVKKLAGKLHLPITTARINVGSLAKKRSLEEAAREARLDFLFKTAKRIKADKIALGHTKDDQAETVLMRLIRGAGLEGLRSILPKRNIRGFIVIRPLIEVTRDEIVKYLKDIKIKPRLDKTNLETKFLRNRIRNVLIPYLKKFNPNIKDILADMTNNIGYDYDYLINVAQTALNNSKSRTKNSEIKINLEKFLKYPLAIQRMMIRLAIKDLKGDLRKISFQHWQEIEDLIYNRPLNSIVNLPAKIAVAKIKNYLSVSIKQST